MQRRRGNWTDRQVSPPCPVQEGGKTVETTVEQDIRLIKDLEEAGPSEIHMRSGSASSNTVKQKCSGGREESSPGRKDEPSSAPKTAWPTVAGIRAENRRYIRIEIEGRVYRALFDPGAMCTFFGPALIERLKDRLEKSNTTVKGATGERQQIRGAIKVRMEVDGHEGHVRAIALDTLDHDVILGMDYCYEWDIDARFARGLWRAREGEWIQFDHEDNVEEAPIVAECAGISELTAEEQREIEARVERILQSQQEGGVTSLTEHHIEVDDETPVKHHPRRMSPKMWQVAHEEVERMYREGIIEKSASDWCSAPVIVKK